MGARTLKRFAALGIVLSTVFGVIGPASATDWENYGDPDVLLRVTPSDNLPKRAVVRVEGMGFGDFAAGDMLQCYTNVELGIDECSNNSVGTFTSDANGNFQARAVVRIRYTTPEGTVINCRRVDCFIWAVAVDFEPSPPMAYQSAHHISFASA